MRFFFSLSSHIKNRNFKKSVVKQRSVSCKNQNVFTVASLISNFDEISSTSTSPKTNTPFCYRCVESPLLLNLFECLVDSIWQYNR